MSATHHRIDRAWKTLARALIERVGGIDAAASVTRVGRAQLSNYQSSRSAAAGATACRCGPYGCRASSTGCR